MPNTSDKWITLTEYLDEETGELLYTMPEKHYITKITHLPTDYGKTHNVKKIRKHIRRNQQGELFTATPGTT